jgi:hypothetical protein
VPVLKSIRCLFEYPCQSTFLTTSYAPLSKAQEMYACIHETGRGFFEGVCAPSNATANFRDPPRNTKEPEPQWQDSGPKRITLRATVDGDLA